MGFRSFRFLLAALALLALLGPARRAAAAPRMQDGRIVIEFWHGMGRDQGAEVNRIAAQFNQTQTKYVVEPVYQGRYDALHQKLIASLYARRNPALSQMYPGWITRFYKYGYLTPAADFIAKDPNFGEKEVNDFYQVMLDENTLKDPKTGKPTLVTLPFNKSVYVLYINQTRLDELHLAAPKTWDEFLDVADKLTVRPEGGGTPTVYGFATRPYIEDLTVQALSANSQLLDEESGKILVTSEPVEAAFKFLQRLTGGEGKDKVGYVETDYLSNVFGSGKIAMYISSTASFTYNDTSVGGKFIWRAYAVPARDKDTPGKTLTQGTNIGIFSNLSEEEQEGAWEFLKYLTSPEITVQWALATGYMPVRHSANTVPKFAERLQNDISYANSVATLDSAAFEPRLIYWESIRALVSRQVEAVLLGRLSVEEAVKQADKEIEDIRQTAK